MVHLPLWVLADVPLRGLAHLPVFDLARLPLQELVAFLVVALAASRIGAGLAKGRLPLITGFLVAGIAVGPFGLGFLTAEATVRLKFLTDAALAFIAFAAGAEILIEETRAGLRQLAAVLVGQTVAVLALGGTAFFFLAGRMPFLVGVPAPRVGAAALLGAIIMVARSPSTALAVVKEVRARGPFTRAVLGITVLSDAVVIVLFAIGVSVADALVGAGFDAAAAARVVVELALDVVLGFAAAAALRLALARRVPAAVTAAAVLVVGDAVFVVAAGLHHVSLPAVGAGVLTEPLLVCMVAGFAVANFTDYRADFEKTLADVGPMVFVVFFTLVGAALRLDVLAAAWMVVAALVVARVLALVAGSVLGAAGSEASLQRRATLGLAFVTQAGISIGLAEEVAGEFPGWGAELATLTIAVIVVNQIVGPPLLRWTLSRVGEAHPPLQGQGGPRVAVIFGLEGQSVALARQLASHGWEARVAVREADGPAPDGTRAEVVTVDDYDLAGLRAAGADTAGAIVTLLSDDENYRLCRLAAEELGTPTVVARLGSRGAAEGFHDLGVLVVEPGTALVSLMDHMVRSPVAASLLLGLDGEQEVADVVVRSPALDGVALRDLRLPLDALILAVHRDGHTIVSHGYTRLRRGDVVTVVGSEDAIEEVRVRLRA